MGITQARLSKYERGKNAPTVELLLKLKHISGKSIDWIGDRGDLSREGKLPLEKPIQPISELPENTREDHRNSVF